MGTYLNPGNEKFRQAANSEIYIDKSGLIEYTNQAINTAEKYICVSRPRRFGKTMAADMLTAYYSRGCDSKELFSALQAAQSRDFEKHRNQYHTVFLNMQEFLSRSKNIPALIERVNRLLMRELKALYPQVDYFDDMDFIESMQDAYAGHGCQFIFIIDEWDCIFREYSYKKEAQNAYLDFLRDLLKDKGCISLVYMTGILPIKKYGTHSALNMFDEFSMLHPGPLASYVGFTEQEVEMLCSRYHMEMEEVKNWYDGYSFETQAQGHCQQAYKIPAQGCGRQDVTVSIYNPRSVVSCMRFGKIGNYWNQTETFEALRNYIDMNFDGLRDSVLCMIAGEGVPVNTESFANDMTTLQTKDDVLTLLLHLGYLGYRSPEKLVFIPNNEIRAEYVNAVSLSDWGRVSDALKHSAGLLQAIWQGRADSVADGIELAHFETSHLQYNDENALSYTISLALYAARNFYTVHRKFAGGKGFADLVFLPRKEFMDKPAMVVELKWNQSAAGALEQIKKKKYCQSLEAYQGKLLLVGINYDRKSKQHTCKIEAYQKPKT